MDSLIVKKTQEPTKDEGMWHQTKLVIQSYADWDQYLTPAPLSIALLGELVFISSSTDFSINKNPPEDGYKFIKYPESFRACLMQVCNSGCWAFNEAHTNMDKIRLHTLNVPYYMKTTVNILFQGNDEVVNALLPDSMENIRIVAHDCRYLAEVTEHNFTDVTNIINELLQACINNEQCYREERNTTTKMLDKGVKAMLRVMVEWEEMVRFFKMLSNIVKTSLTNTLQDFISTSEETKKLSYYGKLFCKDLLYNQAFQASCITSFVHMISSIYTKVSKYLMDLIKQAMELIVMDQSNNVLQKHKQLRDEFDDAGQAILQLVQKNKEELERKVEERLQKIDKELLAILTAAAPEQIVSIKTPAEEGFGVEKEYSAYY